MRQNRSMVEKFQASFFFFPRFSKSTWQIIFVYLAALLVIAIEFQSRAVNHPNTVDTKHIDLHN